MDEIDDATGPNAHPALGLPRSFPGPRRRLHEPELWEFSRGSHVALLYGHPWSRSQWTVVIDTGYFDPDDWGDDREWLADELYLNGSSRPSNLSNLDLQNYLRMQNVKAGLEPDPWATANLLVDGRPEEFHVLMDGDAWVATREDQPRSRIIHILARSVAIEAVELVSTVDLSEHPEVVGIPPR